MLLRQFLIPVFLIHFQHIFAEDDPVWFPNLACRPNHDEAAIASLRELAKKCNNFKKGDACAMHCVLQEWEVASKDIDEIHFILMHLEFFPKIYKDEAFAKLLGETMEIACEPFSIGQITFSENTTMTQCSNNPTLYHCVESYMNCSRDVDQYYSPLDLYDLSCHPEYDNITTNARMDQERTDRKCKWNFPDNYMCGMQCVLSQDWELPNRIRSYRKAIADNDQKMANIEALSMGSYIPRLARHREPTKDELDFYGYINYVPEGIHIGKKIAENCAPLFVEPVINEKNWMHPVPCTDVSDEWKKYINCIDDIWKCRA